MMLTDIPTLTIETLKKEKTYLKLIRKQQKEMDATKKKHSKVSCLPELVYFYTLISTK